MQLLIDILSSGRLGLNQVQLAGELIAARAGYNDWYVDEFHRQVPDIEFDTVGDRVADAYRSIKAGWQGFEGDNGEELTRAMQDALHLMKRILPARYQSALRASPTPQDLVRLEVSGPAGLSEMTLRQWIDRGPLLNKPDMWPVTARRVPTGEPLPLTVIPPEYRQGSLASPWPRVGLPAPQDILESLDTIADRITRLFDLPRAEAVERVTAHFRDPSTWAGVEPRAFVRQAMGVVRHN